MDFRSFRLEGRPNHIKKSQFSHKNVLKPDSCGRGLRPRAKVLLQCLNLSNADTEGTEQSVRNREISVARCHGYDVILKASLTV